MLEDVDIGTLYKLHHPRTYKDGLFIRERDIPEDEREGKYFDKYGYQIYLPEGYVMDSSPRGEYSKKAIGRKLLKKVIRKAFPSASKRGVEDIEYPVGTVVTEDMLNNLSDNNKDYINVYSLETYPADIPEGEFEKTVRKALKQKQMDDAIRQAFEKQKNILKGIDGNLEDDDDD